MTFWKHFFHQLYTDIWQNRIAMVCILIYVLAAQALFHSVCPIAIIFGVPCPACGLTRAGVCFLCGHWREALFFHPAIFIIIPFFLYLMLFRYGFQRKPPLLAPIAIAVGVITIIIYVIRLVFASLPSVPVGIL